ARHQFQNSQGTQPHGSAHAACSCRRGDRIRLHRPVAAGNWHGATVLIWRENLNRKVSTPADLLDGQSCEVLVSDQVIAGSRGRTVLGSLKATLYFGVPASQQPSVFGLDPMATISCILSY